MSYVAEFTIPAESFPFGQTLQEMPDLEVEVDEIIPADETALPFFWVRGCDPDEFVDAAEHESEVWNTRLLEAVGDVALFRAEWHPNAAVIQGLKDLDATIVESVGTASHWRFEVRTESREPFARFQTIFREQGVPIDLRRLYSLDELLEGHRPELTTTQRETILAAYNQGYFDEPRETTQDELSDQFGVSRRAVSERLRRATRNLVEATLLPAGES